MSDIFAAKYSWQNVWLVFGTLGEYGLGNLEVLPQTGREGNCFTLFAERHTWWVCVAKLCPLTILQFVLVWQLQIFIWSLEALFRVESCHFSKRFSFLRHVVEVVPSLSILHVTLL